MMYVTCQTVTETSVFRVVGGRWVRITRTWDIGLRPTKGWKKISSTKRKEEWVDRHHRPANWRRGITRTMTPAK